MLIEQVYLNCLSQASYFVADENKKVGAVIDPRRDIDEYLDLARRHDVKIEHIFLTHFHADFVAGHLELQQATGAKIYLGRQAQADFPFVPLGDADSIELGALRIRAIETPGHTPESICLILFNGAGDSAHAVFTGDTLFVGDVGRPDLSGGEGLSTEQLAGLLFDSLQKLTVLPDETLVYPAHGPGSLCGKQLGCQSSSTIGSERTFNYALRTSDRQAFVQTICSELPFLPAYFAYNADLNKRSRPLLSELMATALMHVKVEQLVKATSEGAQLLDVRSADEFTSGHVSGSICVPLNGRFASYAGAFLIPDKPIYVVANPGQEQEVVVRLGRIGFQAKAFFNYNLHRDELERHSLIELSARLSGAQLRQRLSSESPVVLDVRNPGEWESGHIPGSRNLPLLELPLKITSVPRDRKVIVHCQSGYRSSIAMSLLLRAGYTNCEDLTGGFLAWEKEASANELACV